MSNGAGTGNALDAISFTPGYTVLYYRSVSSTTNVTFCRYEWGFLFESCTFLVQKSSRRCHHVTLRISHITTIIVTLNTPNNLEHVRIFIPRAPTLGIPETPEHHMLGTDRYVGDSSQSVHVDATIIRSFQKELFQCVLPSMYAAHVSLAAGRPWSCMPKWQYGDIVDFITFRVWNFVSV